MKNIKFRVRAHSENATKTIVKARNFEFAIDEPEDLGGTNQAANPVEYLLGAFAGCINVMGHVIAAELNMKLEGLEVTISGNLNPDKLFGKSMEDRAGYKTIEALIKPHTDADETTIEKWKDLISQRCPVSDNLKNATEVKLATKAISLV